MGFMGIDRTVWETIGKVGKSFLPSTISGMVDIFDRKGDKQTADKIKDMFADDETRIELEKLALEKSKNDKNFQLEMKEMELKEKEIALNDRENARDFAKNDNKFGHKFSKVIRPGILAVLTLAFLLLIFSMFGVHVYALFNNFEQTEKMNELFKILLEYIKTPLSIVFVFYFSSRGAEKIYDSHIQGKK